MNKELIGLMTYMKLLGWWEIRIFDDVFRIITPTKECYIDIYETNKQWIICYKHIYSDNKTYKFDNWESTVKKYMELIEWI